MIYIIGCGGVGTWLAPLLLRLTKDQIVLVDGDKFEEKNLDRQFFDKAHLGMNKAEAMASMLQSDRLSAIPLYFDRNTVVPTDLDLFMVCVDNHSARNEALELCDRWGCTAILGGNETYSSEAFYYNPSWRGQPWDPRVYYPEITTDKSGDPIRAAMGCVQAQQTNPQLATANFMAAAQMAHLFTVWELTPEGDRATNCEHYPYLISNTLTKASTRRISDIKKGQNENQQQGS